MKKFISCLAVLAAVCLAAAGVLAESVEGLLEGIGLSPEEVKAFEVLTESMAGEASQDDLRSLLEQYAQSGGQPIPGTLSGDVYTDDANGFSAKIPPGWALQDMMIGPAIVITGPADTDGIAPTITISSDVSSQDNLMNKTKEEIDELLGQALANYMPIALDDFEFLGVPARELVCMYGVDESLMLMQYQLQFVSDEGRVFMVTLTTLAEEAAHEIALDTYDAFLMDFTLR